MPDPNSGQAFAADAVFSKLTIAVDAAGILANVPLTLSALSGFARALPVGAALRVGYAGIANEVPARVFVQVVPLKLVSDVCSARVVFGARQVRQCVEAGRRIFAQFWNAKEADVVLVHAPIDAGFEVCLDHAGSTTLLVLAGRRLQTA